MKHKAIEEALDRLQDNVIDDDGRALLKAQKEFYDRLELNRVYDFYNGEYEDEIS